MIDAVLSYTIGMSTTEAAWLTTVARSGESEAEFIARLMPAAQQAAAGHAHLAGSYAESAATSTDPVAPRDGEFAYGLDVVLDRLSLRLARQTLSARSAVSRYTSAGTCNSVSPVASCSPGRSCCRGWARRSCVDTVAPTVKCALSTLMPGCMLRRCGSDGVGRGPV